MTLRWAERDSASSALQALVVVSATVLLTKGEVVVRPQSTGQAAGQLTLCHAGSLQAAFTEVEKTFATLHPGVTLTAVSGGSVALAGRLAAGSQSLRIICATDRFPGYRPAAQADRPCRLHHCFCNRSNGPRVSRDRSDDVRSVCRRRIQPPGIDPSRGRRLVSAPHGAWSTDRGLSPVPRSLRLPIAHDLSIGADVLQAAEPRQFTLEHYTILPNVGEPVCRPTGSLGKDYDFQFIYEHSAASAAKNNPSARYVTVNRTGSICRRARITGTTRRPTVTIPALGSATAARSPVAIPAARVAWGLTIPKKSPHPENAIAFVNLLLGSVGTTAASTRMDRRPSLRRSSARPT